MPKYSIWKVNQVEHYFKRVSDTEWIETKDGIYFARFSFIRKKDNDVTLKKIDGGFDLTLNYNYSSIHLIGKWII